MKTEDKLIDYDPYDKHVPLLMKEPNGRWIDDLDDSNISVIRINWNREGGGGFSEDEKIFIEMDEEDETGKYVKSVMMSLNDEQIKVLRDCLSMMLDEISE